MADWIERCVEEMRQHYADDFAAIIRRHYEWAGCEHCQPCGEITIPAAIPEPTPEDWEDFQKSITEDSTFWKYDNVARIACHYARRVAELQSLLDSERANWISEVARLNAELRFHGISGAK